MITTFQPSSSREGERERERERERQGGGGGDKPYYTILNHNSPNVVSSTVERMASISAETIIQQHTMKYYHMIIALVPRY